MNEDIFLPEEPQRAELNPFARFWVDVWRCIRRVVACNFQKTRVTDREASKLAFSATPITEPVGQSYAAWRRSALWIAAVALFVHVIILFSTFRFQETHWRNRARTMERKELDRVRKAYRRDPARTIAMARNNPLDYPRLVAIQRGRSAEEKHVKDWEDRTIKELQPANLAIIDAVILVGDFTALASAAMVLLGAVFWSRLRLSRLLSRIGWGILFVSPLVLGLLPLAKMMDFSNLPPEARKSVVYILGAFFAANVFARESGKVLAFFPGIIRSSMGLKTLLPESAVPGWIVALIAPVYFLFILLFVVTANQLQGGWLLIWAAICLMAAPAVYLVFAKAIVRPHSSAEIGSIVTPIRIAVAVLNLIGLVLLSIWVIDLPMVGIGDIFKFIFGLIANVLLLTVVVSDLVIQALRFGYIQTRGFEGSRLQEALDRRFAGLAQVGRGASDPESTPPPNLGGGDDSQNPFDTGRTSDDSLVLQTGAFETRERE